MNEDYAEILASVLRDGRPGRPAELMLLLRYACLIAYGPAFLRNIGRCPDGSDEEIARRFLQEVRIARSVRPA